MGKQGVKSMVPKVGIEPTRGCPHQILSLARLPISPLRRGIKTKYNGALSET